MNPVKDIRAVLQGLVEHAVAQCCALGIFSLEVIPPFVIEVPNQKNHGDFACNIAMLLAKPLRQAPKKIAEQLAAAIDLTEAPEVKKLEVAGAGFINFFLDPAWLCKLPALVAEAGEEYGRGAKKFKKIQVEFVSANPTGNLHMGNARGGALGDSLGNLLQMAGYEVEREYYINDAGNQIEVFGHSLEARYLQLLGKEAPFPENGYAGQDLLESVEAIVHKQGDAYLNLAPAERRQKLTEIALREKLDYIKATLERFGVVYDVWFYESSLHEQEKVAAAVDFLRKNGHTYEREGALWLKNASGEEGKDEVLVRANGLPTYFAADIAYHKDKFDRGFDQVINIWGADHHGHVARMKEAVADLGYDPEALTMLLVQLVHLYRGGQIVRMSKRTGTTVALDELLEEVGTDAARFFFVMRNPDSHLDFDLELARQTNQDNPVYYVQYAHARICSVFRQAQAAGVNFPPVGQIDMTVAAEPEFTLLRKVADYPDEIEAAAENLAPHRIARYLLELAGEFHSYYNHNRVLIEDSALQSARLAVLKSVQQTLRSALTILGVSAPEQM